MWKIQKWTEMSTGAYLPVEETSGISDRIKEISVSMLTKCIQTKLANSELHISTCSKPSGQTGELPGSQGTVTLAKAENDKCKAVMGRSSWNYQGLCLWHRDQCSRQHIWNHLNLLNWCLAAVCRLWLFWGTDWRASFYNFIIDVKLLCPPTGPWISIRQSWCWSFGLHSPTVD